MHNLGQSDFNLFINHIHTKIMIISVMSIDFSRRHYNKAMYSQFKLAKEIFLYRNINIDYFPQTTKI